MAQDKEKKEVTIIVSGSSYPWPKEEITYEEVIKIAFPENTNMNFSVTYERGHGDKPGGFLNPGGSVKVKDGMRFYVKHTGES